VEALYKIEKIYKAYKPNVNILENISFEIKPKEVLCVLGINGVGKTTMIKCLLNLLSVNGGTIFYKNMPLQQIQQKKYYKEVAAVLEGNRNTYWYLTGWQNILYFGRQKGMHEEKLVKRAEGLLRLLDLYHARNEKVSDYSRGMQQKLAIIIALLSEPEVLFLDEPTLGLDYMTQKTMVEVLTQLSKDVTIILTSHQLDVVDQLAKRLIILQDKSIGYDGTAAKFRETHSSGKWTITIHGSANDIDNLPTEAINSQNGELCNIIIRNGDKNCFEYVMSLLLKQKVEIISVKKDSNTIEDVLPNFIENGKGGQEL
jgi:ABC-2 type transport system ATP-binding protein